MKRKRFTEEQIIGVLMSAGSMEAGGHGQSSFARSSHAFWRPLPAASVIVRQANALVSARPA